MGMIAICPLLGALQQLTSPTRVNTSESVVEARENQIAHDKWENLLLENEITTTKITETINHYKFTGNNVQRMSLKEIYYILQNWLLLSDSKTKAKFTINIGGEDFSFRLFRDRNSQLLIEPGNGGKLDSYDALLNIIEDVDQKIMLNSLDKPLGNQPNWKTELSESFKDLKEETDEEDQKRC